MWRGCGPTLSGFCLLVVVGGRILLFKLMSTDDIFEDAYSSSFDICL